MDAPQNPDPRVKPREATRQTARGGSIQPAAPSQRSNQEPQSASNQPIHAAKHIDPMAPQAEKLGSTRTAAIDDSGRRALVQPEDRQQTPQSTRLVQAPETPQLQPRAEPRPTAKTPSDAKADRSAHIAQLEAALNDRYIVKRAHAIGKVTLGTTEYRFRGDTTRLAFTESSQKLATVTNSPTVAKSMVDVAEARQWKSLRVTGNEDFKRMVWLEANARNIKTVGYEPTKTDLERLDQVRAARMVNRIAPARETPSGKSGPESTKQSARGGGGLKAVIAAIEAVLIAKRVPSTHRQAVLAAATEQLALTAQLSKLPMAAVYDSSAKPHRHSASPALERQRTHNRSGLTPER